MADQSLPITYREVHPTGMQAYRVADFVHDGFHLGVFPHHPFLTDPPDGFEVHIWKDKNGDPDFTQEIISSRIDGAPDDLEELADMFANRLVGGAKPEDIFQDIDEANRERMRAAYERLKQG